MSGGRAPWTRRAAHAALRRLPLLGTLIGLGLAVWLVATNDLASVAAAFGRIGVAGFVGVTLVRALVVIVCGVAWARILDGLSPAPASACLILRFVREGINVLLPVASVGGDVLGARLLTFWGVAGSLAAASVLADLLFQVGTLALFAGLGAFLLSRVEGAEAAALASWTLRTLAAAGCAVAAFFALQRVGIVRLVEDRVTALGRRFVRETETRPEPTQRIQGALDTVWAPRRRGRLAQSFALHALAWLLGTAEVFVVLSCIGVDTVGLSDLLVIEALSQAIKAAAFLVPSGLGVQEGGLVLVCGLFGIDAGTAIALSLARRVPDVVLGLPALLVWQNLEARRAGVRPATPTCDRP
ncbi:lysylphosphatidylglycerol synthase domain-containing protein [Methylobacterium sp. J-070]|uniref:lysylphosphatidylglycerol synthase domain-containing protein n=1 Tax=Methylobacterium sp. J-070 TaxID=2836650 RepID=UPI001FB987CD|nr:lysylphosphatidylglycerol synthase domain-containing protein [Methylobacterium sp. J-070]MCJ2054562.1 lysylphosphatidylglycerol synthase domain-containing protein [Methylobacterium sp. J-070]